MSNNSDLVIQVCLVCREQNLTSQVTFNNCKGCGSVYCIHYASTIDPAYCTECLHDVTVKEEVIIKIQESYNPETDKLTSRTRKAKKITLGGMHWLFQARRIESLTDLELELAIEYHRDILNQMLLERDERRIERFHRNRGKGLPIRFDQGSVAETTLSEETITKKTRIKQAVKADPMAVLQAAINMMKQSGMTPEMIARMAGRK
jgi:hypothetical protein